MIPAGRGLKSDEEEKNILRGFSVEATMKEVSDNYVEEHDRSVQEIHEKIEKMKEEGK